MIFCTFLVLTIEQLIVFLDLLPSASLLLLWDGLPGAVSSAASLVNICAYQTAVTGVRPQDVVLETGFSSILCDVCNSHVHLVVAPSPSIFDALQ